MWIVRAVACFGILAAGFGVAHASDEISSGDKLRMLYSNQFQFTDDGTPLITVEVMSNQQRVTLSSRAMVVLPDGVGGSELRAGDEWTVELENTQPAEILEWTVVAKHHPSDTAAIRTSIKKWRHRAFSPRTFETGTLFGVAGETLDSRKTLVAISPRKHGLGRREATRVAEQYNVKTSLYTEVVKLPRGTVVARSGKSVVRNPSMIWFAPSSSKNTVKVHNVLVGTGGSTRNIRRETRRYFGRILITIGKDGKLTVVNSVRADQLLAGIVPSEMFASAPIEALKSQAIAARTELIQKLGQRHFGDPFLLCSTQQCQVYAGAGKEHPRTTRAVRETRGMVMRRKDGDLVDARYSAACGGHSETKTHIWGGEADGNLIGTVDAIPGTPSAQRFAKGITAANLEAFLNAPARDFYEGRTRFSKGRFRWDRKLSVAELSRLIARHYPKVGRVTRLTPKRRGTSGRIAELRIEGEGGTAVARGDLHIRRLLGGFRSTLFAIKKIDGETFHFRGAGFGHGVGMCQIGAIGSAQMGEDIGKILSRYYGNIRIQPLY